MKGRDILNDQNLRKGFNHLIKKEPLFKTLLKQKNYEIKLFNKKKGFEGLVGLIVDQQLSVASARAIFNRMTELIKPFTAENFIEVSETDLKGAGLSSQKINYCKGIANKIISGDLNLKSLEKKEDSEIIEELVKIKGIGEWTAKCYLLACLKRIDVWPAADLGLMVAIQKLKGMKERPKQLTIEEIAASWSPYRSVAALLLWSTHDKE
jgi:DNA-3-methyladenine glycosylase II